MVANEKVDSSTFSKELAKKRHAELLEAFRGIKLPETKDYSDMLKRLENAISGLGDLIKAIPAPNVNVQKTDFDNSAVVKAIESLSAEMCNLHETLLKSPAKKEYNFEIIRNLNGFIQSVNVKEV